MVVVPALALFSHHVPPEAVAAVRKLVTGGLAAWSGSGQPPSASLPPSAVAPPPPVQAATPAPGLASATVPVAASAPRPLPVPARGAVPPATGRRAIEDRLLELGASAIECQPLPGGGGTLLASCTVAADPSGQLQRLFQAAGPEPTAALERLLADVEGWRRRMASRQAVTTR